MTILEQSPPTVQGFRPRMSEAAFEKWALRQENLRVEWVDGEVIFMAPTNEDHADTVDWLFTLLKMYVEEHNLGKLRQTEFMVRLPQRRRLPDIFFVSQANKGKFTKTYFQGAPDLAVEVVSPDSVSRDWREKYLEYQDAGVREYWIIDHGFQTAEFYQLKRGKYQPLPVTKGVLKSLAVPGFWFKVEWLWTVPPLPVLKLAREIGII